MCHISTIQGSPNIRPDFRRGIGGQNAEQSSRRPEAMYDVLSRAVRSSSLGYSSWISQAYGGAGKLDSALRLSVTHPLQKLGLT